MEIHHLRYAITGSLSSGEVSRVNLCKALLNRPELLLLDEPTASLDPDIADKVRKILRRVQQEDGVAILYTSHNMRDIEEICDRVLFLRAGHLMTEGTPAQVIDNPVPTTWRKCLFASPVVARSSTLEDQTMTLQRIWVIVLRYAFVYRRSPIRLIEVLFWPTMSLLVWGFMTTFHSTLHRRDLARLHHVLNWGDDCWDILFRAQQGVSLSFLEISGPGISSIFSVPLCA